MAGAAVVGGPVLRTALDASNRETPVTQPLQDGSTDPAREANVAARPQRPRSV
jgi:hypothetical protein